MGEYPQDELVRRALARLGAKPPSDLIEPVSTIMQANQPEHMNAGQPDRSVIRPGDLIAWQRAGVEQIGLVGLVDFLHVDSAGVVWAFVTIGETWAAVNLKYANRMSDDEGRSKTATG